MPVASLAAKNEKILPTVLCKIVANGCEVKVRALLDTGSTINLLSRHVGNVLGLVGKTKTLVMSVAGGGGKESKEIEAEVEIKPVDENDPFSMKILCHTLKKVLEPLKPVRLDPERHDELKGIPFVETFPQTEESEVDLILDEEATFEIMKGQIIRDVHGPKAIDTKLGYVLAGGYVREKRPKQVCAAVKQAIPNYEAFMSLEDLGIVERDTEYTAEDQEAVDLMTKLTSYDAQEKRYTTGLLWKKDPKKYLDDNYAVAKHIAVAAKKRCDRLGYARQVNEAYQEQIKLGHAEKVKKGEEKPDHPTYHIPTHPVF